MPTGAHADLAVQLDQADVVQLSPPRTPDGLTAAAIVAIGATIAGKPYHLRLGRDHDRSNAITFERDNSDQPWVVRAYEAITEWTAHTGVPGRLEAVTATGLLAQGFEPSMLAEVIPAIDDLEHRPGIAMPGENYSDGFEHSIRFLLSPSTDLETTEGVALQDPWEDLTANNHDTIADWAILKSAADGVGSRWLNCLANQCRPLIGPDGTAPATRTEYLLSLCHKAPSSAIAILTGMDPSDRALTRWRKRGTVLRTLMDAIDLESIESGHVISVDCPIDDVHDVSLTLEAFCRYLTDPPLEIDIEGGPIVAAIPAEKPLESASTLRHVHFEGSWYRLCEHSQSMVDDR